MKVIESELAIFCHQVRLPIVGMNFILFALLANQVPLRSLKIKADARDRGLLSEF